MTPSWVISPAQTRVFLALLRVWEHKGTLRPLVAPVAVMDGAR